jgi:hypothetical protein
MRPLFAEVSYGRRSLQHLPLDGATIMLIRYATPATASTSFIRFAASSGSRNT